MDHAMMVALGHIALWLFGFAVVMFVVAVAIKRNDIADVGWGMGYLVVIGYFLQNSEPSVLFHWVAACVALWALRLSWHIGKRAFKKPEEDFRYKQWRKAWGRWVYIRSFFQVFVLQAFFLLWIAAPIWVAGQSQGDVHWTSWVGFALFLFGFLFEALADYQLAQFKKSKTSSSDIMQSGLWKYSRHPNYFGESIVWWGLAMMAFHGEYGWYAWISPLVITYLLVFVSGVPMLEAKYEGNQAFEKYKARTSAFIPWFRKNV
jgi:steroid 5-alpha reductase family enzyme